MELNSGVPLEAIKASAKRAGWTDMDIEEALSNGQVKSRVQPAGREEGVIWKPIVIVLTAAVLACISWWRISPDNGNNPFAYVTSWLGSIGVNVNPSDIPIRYATSTMRIQTGTAVTDTGSAGGQAKASTAPVAGTAGTAPGAPLMKSTGQLFTDSQYASRSFLIFPGSPSAAAERALAGFDMQTKDLGGGVTQVSLVAKAGDYATQVYDVGPGQELFFVETSMGDDNQSQDYAYGDDLGVVVDQNGYILQ
ncbi:MAG: hypothetical protein KGI49_02140 [Patescibacteria group bacterium]|nr:hypothetical protein [Patescibacteria group bacterium]